MKHLTIIAALITSPAFALEPVSPFTFTNSVRSPGGVVDFDASTVTKTADGSRVAGVMRITLTEPVQSSNGKRLASFINVVVADCKKPKLTMLVSRGFTPEGKQLFTLDEPRMYADEKNPAAPVTIGRAFLCSKKTSAPVLGSPKLPDTYTSFWKKPSI